MGGRWKLLLAMLGVMTMLGLAVLCGLAALGAEAASLGVASYEVCDGVTKAFNNVNQVLPMGVDFGAGQVAGIDYPQGRIILSPDARRVDNCFAYTVNNTKTMIAHLEFKENFVIRFSSGKDIPEGLTLTVNDSTVVLHYYIAEKLSSEGKKLLDLEALGGEVKDLGKVTLGRGEGLEEDFTREAEDLLRPGLLGAFNSFAKEQLRWEVDPVDKDVSRDGFESFKLLFKRIMVELDPFGTSA